VVVKIPAICRYDPSAAAPQPNAVRSARYWGTIRGRAGLARKNRGRSRHVAVDAGVLFYALTRSSIHLFTRQLVATVRAYDVCCVGTRPEADGRAASHESAPKHASTLWRRWSHPPSPAVPIAYTPLPVSTPSTLDMQCPALGMLHPTLQEAHLATCSLAPVTFTANVNTSMPRVPSPSLMQSSSPTCT
jgi:hypothetical protein